MKTKKLFSFVLIVALLLGVTSPGVYATAAPDSLNEDYAYNVRATANSLAYNDFLNGVCVNNIYAADYSGAYMDDDGRLVICLIDSSAVPKYEKIFSEQVMQGYLQESKTTIAEENVQLQNVTSANIQADDLVRYEVKKYSYNTLNGLQQSLTDVMEGFEISLTSLRQEENVLRISTVNDTRRPEILAYIQGLGYPVDMVVFEHSDDYGELTSTTYDPGDGITCWDQNYPRNNDAGWHNGTIGFYATQNGQMGVVTAGHVCGSNNSLIYTMGGESAPTEVEEYRQGGPLDAAFALINTAYFNPSNTLFQDTDIHIQSYSSVIEGYLISVFGRTTNYELLARVESASTVHTFQGITYTDLIQFNRTVQEGDSGGPVLFGSSLVGIVHGNTSTSGGNGLACKATNIINAWGLTLYTG